MRTPAGTNTAVFLLGLSALLTIYATQPLLPALAADLGVSATAAA
jgi:MFS transporter, YNFM family, putative membrane transport protein